MWSLDFFWKYFLVSNFLQEIPTITQVIKLMYQSDRFCKSTVYNLQTRMHFLEKSHDYVDKIITQLHLLKGTPNVSFKSISIPEICK